MKKTTVVKVKKSKTKVYIDGANVFYTQKALGWTIDWVKTKSYLNKTWDILELRYYIGIRKEDKKMAGYLRYLDQAGITIITKPLKKIKAEDGIVFKSNFDVEMTTDILLDRVNLEEIILFNGDSDFNYLAKKLKDLGKRITVISSRKMISWELKLTADRYIFLEDIKEKIAREVE